MLINESRMIDWVTMVLFQQQRADQVHSQSDASNANRFIKMNDHRHKNAMHGFARHQKRHYRKYDGAGKAAQHADFSCSETETLVRCVPAGKVIGNGDRKSTRLNSSHRCISYAVFCL